MSEFTSKENDVFEALKRHTEPPRDYINKEKITRDDVEKIKRERKLEELKKELKESEAELNDTKGIIKECDKKITDLSCTKACMEEKLDLVNKKIDALKVQIECLSAKPRVFKCKEQPNPYGATQGAYAIYRNGYFEYKKSLQLNSMACKMTMDFVPSGFEEVTNLFEGLKNGKVMFVVTKEKLLGFLYILRKIDGVHYNEDCIRFDADNLFYTDPYNEESFIVSSVFTSIFFDMKSEITLVMF